MKKSVDLQCTKCLRFSAEPVEAEVPENVVKIVVICNYCDDGDFHPEYWFDANGKDVSPDDRIYSDE